MRPPSAPPQPPPVGVVAGVLGTSEVPADPGIEDGRAVAGAEWLREPRLPLDPPRPARAHASTVQRKGASTISETAATATVRFMMATPSVTV
jgi:hypothetical protein